MAAPTITLTGFPSAEGVRPWRLKGVLTTFTDGFGSLTGWDIVVASVSAGNLTDNSALYAAPTTKKITSVSGGATGQVMRHDGTKPAWSTPTYPNAGTLGKIIRGDGTNYLETTATWPDTVARGDLLRATAANVAGVLAIGTVGKIVRSDGTDPAYSAWNIVNTFPAGSFPYASALDTLGALALGTTGHWLGAGAAAPQYNAPAAFTRTDDTNVTATLAGNPTTALLNAMSLTLGWAGTLSIARGGLGTGTLGAADTLLCVDDAGTAFNYRALATGTAGTDFAITKVDGTITFDLPTASSTVRGALASADWTTFNNKQPAGNYITALTGDVTASGPGSVAATIAANAVTLAKMADMATASFLGRNTAATGDPEVLSMATARTMLSINLVENTALSTWAGTANITTLGTITTGVWTGTTIAIANGGTGATTQSGARTGIGLSATGSTQIADHTGTYTSVDISGANNSWAGINFPGVGGARFMVRAHTQGFYDEAVGWEWCWTNGSLTDGSVPFARITGTVTATTAGTVTTAAQPAITSLGTLTGLAVSGGGVNFTFDTASTTYDQAQLELLSGGTGKPARIGFHVPGVVASQLGMGNDGILRTYDNPGTAYEQFAASAFNVGATQIVDTSRNLVNIGTITSGLINGQTISSAANFTGTLATAGSITTTAASAAGGEVLHYINNTNADVNSRAALQLKTGYGTPIWQVFARNNTLWFGVASVADYMYLNSTALYPATAAGLNLGDGTLYWNDVSYKTLTDRGCLPWCDDGVLMPDGRTVSDLDALASIRKHPTKMTVHGVPMLDYSSLPVISYKNEYGKGEDGAEMTSLFGIMIGAHKQAYLALQQINTRLAALEAKKA